MSCAHLNPGDYCPDIDAKITASQINIWKMSDTDPTSEQARYVQYWKSLVGNATHPKKIPQTGIIQQVSRTPIGKSTTGKRRGCGSCGGGKRKSRKNRQKPAVLNQPLVGTALKEILHSKGFDPGPDCPCNAHADDMDRKGPVWCEENIDTIVGWMKSSAATISLFHLILAAVGAKPLIHMAIDNAHDTYNAKYRSKIPKLKLKKKSIRRNLIYHIYPVTQNRAVWQWNLDQIIQRIGLFNGRIIVGIVHDSFSDPPEMVKEYLSGHSNIEYLVEKNSKNHGENITATKLMESVQSFENEITFRAHAKGVSSKYSGNKGDVIRKWTKMMYAACLDYPDIVRTELQTSAMCGPFRRLKRVGRASWYFSGSFYWYEHERFYTRDWKSLESKRYGVESLPGLMFDPNEVSCVFGDTCGSMYSPKYVDSVMLPLYEEWKSSGVIAYNSTKDTRIEDTKPDAFNLTLITPTGDRPEAFRLCEKWMARQTFKGTVQWIVVDDGIAEKTTITQGQEYYRRKPRKSDPKHTLALNLKEALKHVRGGKILFIEDDEWYSPDYLQEMSNLLDKHVLVGNNPTHYYYIQEQRHREITTHKHSSLCRTGIRSSHVDAVYGAIKGSNPSIDTRLWGTFTGNKHQRTGTPLVLGVKGMPGRKCGGGNPRLGKADTGLKYIKSIIGHDVQFYMPYMSKARKTNTKDVVVYTSIIDGYDTLVNPVHYDESCDYVCFTDKKIRGKNSVWQQKIISKEYACPSKESRYFKMHPPDADWTIYLDGQLQLLVDPMLIIAECKKAGDAELYLFKHHERSTWHEEATEVQRIGFDKSREIREQVSRYTSAGLEDGLYLGGMLIRRRGAAAFNDLWWDEYCSGSHRDQISLPYAIQKSGVAFHAFPPKHWDSFFARKRHKKKRLTRR